MELDEEELSLLELDSLDDEDELSLLELDSLDEEELSLLELDSLDELEEDCSSSRSVDSASVASVASARRVASVGLAFWDAVDLAACFLGVGLRVRAMTLSQPPQDNSRLIVSFVWFHTRSSRSRRSLDVRL